MDLHTILVIILSTDIMILAGSIGTYLGKRSAKPYVEMIDHIGEMNIPLGEKIDNIKRNSNERQTAVIIYQSQKTYSIDSFQLPVPILSGVRILPIYGPMKVGCIWPSPLIYFPGRSLDGH